MSVKMNFKDQFVCWNINNNHHEKLHLFSDIYLIFSVLLYSYNHDVSLIEFKLCTILNIFHSSYFISTIISQHSPSVKSSLHGLIWLIPYVSLLGPLSPIP